MQKSVKLKKIIVNFLKLNYKALKSTSKNTHWSFVSNLKLPFSSLSDEVLGK